MNNISNIFLSFYFESPFLGALSFILISSGIYFIIFHVLAVYKKSLFGSGFKKSNPLGIIRFSMGSIGTFIMTLGLCFVLISNILLAFLISIIVFALYLVLAAIPRAIRFKVTVNEETKKSKLYGSYGISREMIEPLKSGLVIFGKNRDYIEKSIFLHHNRKSLEPYKVINASYDNIHFGDEVIVTRVICGDIFVKSLRDIL